jgi:Cd2+/Zn2+-exporting ATPase
VRSGEQVPVDGEVVKGSLCVDESLLTGEATPIVKGKGKTVLGGTLATDGYAEVKVTSRFAESTLAGIADLVAEAGATQSRTQKAIDSVITWYVPSILVLAGVIALAVPLALGEPIAPWAQRALVLLVSACPCALTLAGVVPGVTGIAAAAQHGAIVKSCDVLDRLGDVNCCAFDKTGTLTEGRFSVTTSRSSIARDGKKWSREEVRHLAASLEAKSSHPLAAAVVSDVVTCVVDAHEKMGANAGLGTVSNFNAMEGIGVMGIVNANGEKVEVPSLTSLVSLLPPLWHVTSLTSLVSLLHLSHLSGRGSGSWRRSCA